MFARAGGFTERAAHRLLPRGAGLAGSGTARGRQDRVRPRRPGLSLQSTGLRQPPAPQLPLGLQRHREQGPDGRRESLVGLPVPRPAGGRQPAHRARDHGLHPGLLDPRARGGAAPHAARRARRAPRLLRRAWSPGAFAGSATARPPARRGHAGNDPHAAHRGRVYPRPARRCSSVRSTPCCARRAPPAEILVVDNAPAGGESARWWRPASPRCATSRSRSPGSTSPATARWPRPGTRCSRFSTTTRWPTRTGPVRCSASFATEPGVAVCTGRVEPLGLNTPGERLFEANGGFSRGQRADRPPGSRGPSAARPAGAAHRLGDQRRERL